MASAVLSAQICANRIGGRTSEMNRLPATAFLCSCAILLGILMAMATQRIGAATPRRYRTPACLLMDCGAIWLAFAVGGRLSKP